MQVFKALMKVYLRTLPIACIYIFVFIGMVILIDKMTQPATIESFSDKKVPVAIMDHDNSEISHALTEYLQQTQNLVKIEDDKDALQDALYYRKVEYLLVIPEGFSESINSNEPLQLDTTKLPGSYSGIFLDMQIEEFLTTFRCYKESGMDADTALAKAIETQKLTVNAVVVSEEGKAIKQHGFGYFYQLFPYAIMATIISLIGTSILTFNKKEVARRNRCGALPLFKRNLQMILGGIIVAICIWVLFMACGFVMYGKELIESGVLPWLIMNSLVMLLVSVGLAYLIGTIAKEKQQISGLCTTVSLAFSFLGGVFVSTDMMSKGVQNAAQAIPTSWYVKANSIFNVSESIVGENRNTVITCLLVQVLFALAFFAVSTVISKVKSGRE